MKFDSTASASLRDIMRWRRDVRHFRPEPIPDDVVERLEQSMVYAPSVGNSRPWRVFRVESEGLRRQVRAIFEACNDEAAKGYDSERTQLYRQLKLAGLDQAPLQLAVFTDCDPVEGHSLGRRTLPATLEQSTAMAIHTLWLTARAENVGLGMLSILDAERMEAIFEVPESWRFSSYLCLGWPCFEDDTPLLDRAGWQENTALGWTRR